MSDLWSLVSDFWSLHVCSLLSGVCVWYLVFIFSLVSNSGLSSPVIGLWYLVSGVKCRVSSLYTLVSVSGVFSLFSGFSSPDFGLQPPISYDQSLVFSLWWLISVLWSFVDGSWSLVSSVYTLVSGAWFLYLVSDLSSLIFGIKPPVSYHQSLVIAFYSLVCGPWSLVYGV